MLGFFETWLANSPIWLTGIPCTCSMGKDQNRPKIKQKSKHNCPRVRKILFDQLLVWKGKTEFRHFFATPSWQSKSKLVGCDRLSPVILRENLSSHRHHHCQFLLHLLKTQQLKLATFSPYATCMPRMGWSRQIQFLWQTDRQPDRQTGLSDLVKC